MAITEEAFPVSYIKIGPRERLISTAMERLICKYAVYTSYRVSEELLNETLLRSKSKMQTKARTMCNHIEKAGEKLKNALEQHSIDVLERFGFDKETLQPANPVDFTADNQQGSKWPEEEVHRLAEVYNKRKQSADEMIHEEAIQAGYENALYTVYVCADDIGVPKQKEHRKNMDETPDERTKTGRKKRHFVENTVVSVHTQAEKQNSEKVHYFAGIGMKNVLVWVLAYLLSRDYSGHKELVFFTDGASNLRKSFRDVFGFCQYKVFLDWFHLCKKLSELLSMSLRNRKTRNEVLDKLKRILWAGNVDDAIAYIKGISKKSIKSQTQMDAVALYLEKHKEEIPCYALRNQLGLRNASQAVESANFCLVAHRQKVGGMSWSNSGSEALSLLRTIFENDEDVDWFYNNHLSWFHSESVSTQTA